jgi:hydrogenase-4 component F
MGLHAVSHSLTKGGLFLVAGNLLAAYQTRSVKQVSGLTRAQPLLGWLWLTGFLAITGAPPFGTFLSEWTILRAALAQGRPLVVVGYLGLLALIFLGMAGVVLPMLQGPAKAPAPAAGHGARETGWGGWALLSLPSVVLFGLVLILGTYVPAPVRGVLEDLQRRSTPPAAEVTQSVGGGNGR